MQVKVQLAPYLKKKLWPYVWQVAWKDFQVFACTRSPIVGPSLGFLCTRIVFIINPLHLLFFNSQRGKRKMGDLHHYPSLWQLDLARLPYAFFSLQLWCAWFFHLFWSHSHLPEWECYRDLHKMHSCFCLACAFLKLLVLLCSVMWPLPSLWKCKCCGCVLLPRHFFYPQSACCGRLNHASAWLDRFDFEQCTANPYLFESTPSFVLHRLLEWNELFIQLWSNFRSTQ